MPGGENEEEESAKNEGAGKWAGQVEEAWDLGETTQADLVTPETLFSGEKPSMRWS